MAEKEYLKILAQAPLFSGMTIEEIERCVKASGSEVVHYQKDEIIFYQEQEPTRLHLLLEGAVVIGSDSVSGKRSIIATFTHSGELFGEVFLFLNKQTYDNYAQAAGAVKVLEMPKDFVYRNYGEDSRHHIKLVSNMLEILARKAYYLNGKIQIMSAMTLRQKIARTLLQHSDASGKVSMQMNREELADFLGSARPSVSRELMKMQEDGLLILNKREISLTDREQLQEII